MIRLRQATVRATALSSFKHKQAIKHCLQATAISLMHIKITTVFSSTLLVPQLILDS